MERRLNMVVLVTMAVAAMLQSSSAQTVYVVGDASGWEIPTGVAATYTTWAANKTFRVGDILDFNFATGAHDVAKVTRANFDSCNGSNPLLMLSNGPANVTLNETGDHYFLCAFAGHCNAGQKLAVNVSAAASSPAPQPSTPAPQPSSPPTAPTPQPSAPAPAPQAGSPSPISAAPPAPTPSPSTATPPPPAGDNGTPSTPPTATPPSSTGDNGTPSTPPNSATSLGVAGRSATFLSFVVAFFFM